MSRTTLGDAKDPSQCAIASILNVSPDDPRFNRYVNISQQKVVQTGEGFWGLHALLQFCVTGGCITLPRQVAAVETVAICTTPIPIFNSWFQFIANGPGLASDGGSCNSNSCGGPGWNEKRGDFCAFEDIVGLNKKIRVYADVTEADGAKILLSGYDENRNWIRTEPNGAGTGWVDGEYVALTGGPVLSTKFFSALTGVQKPITNGTIRLYEYNTDLLTQRAMAIYEPDETRPSYRRALINGMCCGSDADDTTQVTVMAKLEFIPARLDTDWLLIGNLPALELECQSVAKLEKNLPQEAMMYHAMALQTLRNELRHYVAKSAVNPIRMLPRNIAGAGVRNIL